MYLGLVLEVLVHWPIQISAWVSTHVSRGHAVSPALHPPVTVL